MSELEFVAVILALVGPLLAVARFAGVPPTLALFGSGVAVAFVPGLPPVRVDPQMMVQLFLPPILYAAAVRTSFHLLRYTLVSGVLLGAVLGLASVGACTVAAHLLLPGLPWNAALLLGIVATLFDTRLFHEAKGRPSVPRAIADALKTREMVARVVVLACFSLAIEPPASMPAAVGAMGWEIAAGAAVGLLVGYGVGWLRERIDVAPIEIAVSIATPYLASLLARAAGASVVAAVIAAALVIAAVRTDRRTGQPISSSEARISATAFWEEISLILSSVLYFLTGRALPEALGALKDWPLWWLAAGAAGLLAVGIAVQYAVAVATALLPSVRAVTGGPGSAAAVMTWASTRSVIGLVVALSIPGALPDGRPFAERDLILVVAALVIVGSVLVQGLTLRPLVRNVPLAEKDEEEREVELARGVVERAGVEGFDVVRRDLLVLRADNRIGDEVLRRMLREVDLRSRATEESALPGAGPPNP